MCKKYLELLKKKNHQNLFCRLYASPGPILHIFFVDRLRYGLIFFYDSKRLPGNDNFWFGNKKKSHGDIPDVYGAWSIIVMQNPPAMFCTRNFSAQNLWQTRCSKFSFIVKNYKSLKIVTKKTAAVKTLKSRLRSKVAM